MCRVLPGMALLALTIPAVAETKFAYVVTAKDVSNLIAAAPGAQAFVECGGCVQQGLNFGTPDPHTQVFMTVSGSTKVLLAVEAVDALQLNTVHPVSIVTAAQSDPGAYSRPFDLGLQDSAAPVDAGPAPASQRAAAVRTRTTEAAPYFPMLRINRFFGRSGAYHGAVSR